MSEMKAFALCWDRLANLYGFRITGRPKTSSIDGEPLSGPYNAGMPHIEIYLKACKDMFNLVYEEVFPGEHVRRWYLK